MPQKGVHLFLFHRGEWMPYLAPQQSLCASSFCHIPNSIQLANLLNMSLHFRRVCMYLPSDLDRHLKCLPIGVHLLDHLASPSFSLYLRAYWSVPS
jgi:hypothetical protein